MVKQVMKYCFLKALSWPVMGLLLLGLVATPWIAQSRAERRADDGNVAKYFDQHVAPIFAANCLSCHSGPKPKGELDLSSLKTTLDAVVIEPGKPGESFLWEEIESNNMPPKHPLSDEDKALIKKWIEDGAKWGTDPIDPFAFSSDKRAGKDWWSLQPLKQHDFPTDQDDAWSLNAVDRFVYTRLKEEGLQPSPRADPRTLVRRLYVDLIGLPAPPEVIEAFEKDPSQQAWEKLVDDLLASEHYGERWARHWLDVARFGESSGFEYNSPRNHSYHYRDWVIRAFNEDMPYDKFVKMQLAGDLIKPDTIEGAAATGFLVAGVHNAVQGKNPKMRMTGRQNELEEISGTVGQAFLGMTVHCARCHDHKFDPISEKEYYQFIAALDGVNHGERKVQHVSQPEHREGEDETRAQQQAAERKRIELARQLTDLIVSRGGQLSASANIVTTKQAYRANDKGETYRVSFKLAPTVWAGPDQATAQGDGVLVRLINEDGQVVASRFVSAEGWEGGKNAGAYKDASFTYQGDGSGSVRLQLQPYPLSSGRFGGAVDDVKLSHNDRVLFSDQFDAIKQKQPHGMQAHTLGRVYHSAVSDHWDHVGINAIHAEQRDEGNLALQLFGGRTGETLQAKTPAERELQAQLSKLAQPDKQNSHGEVVTIYSVVSRNPGVMRVHQRGSVDTLGEQVPAGGIAAISGPSADFGLAPDAPDRDRRINLAEWIAGKDNPLFHRVAVNRIWHYHFGQGLVNTPNDFGFNGGKPSHPELLDYLAMQLRDNGYSLKQLHRLIVTSQTYQQASRGVGNATAKKANAIDQGNRLLWRQNPRRVEAEVFRDSVLAISGVLNKQMYGPGYKDVRIDQVPPAYYYAAIDPVGPQFNRRTIYRWMPRGQRSALLDTFDCPDPSVTAPKRSVTTTPSQALSQWNHSFVLRMSDHLAKRVEQEAGNGLAKQVERMWLLVHGRTPSEEEVSGATELAEEYGLALLARVLFNTNEFIWIE
jgi:hypothetical protein